MIILSQEAIQKINAPEVETFYLYEINYDEELPPKRWTNWDEPVLYDGHEWVPQTIRHTEVTTNSDGSVSPVNMMVGNIDEDRIVQQLIEQYRLIGKKVRIIQVLSGGLHILTYEYRIASARAVKGQVIFTLSIGFDVFNIRIPGRRIIAGFCAWQFGDGDCKYSPGADEECDNTWQDCKMKDNTPNYGGFPGTTNDYFVL